MQQHSFQHRAFYHLSSCGSFVPSYSLEKIGFCDFRPALIRREKWYPDHHPYITECLCGPWFLVRKASQARWVCFLPYRVAHSLARVFMDGKIGQTMQTCWQPGSMNRYRKCRAAFASSFPPRAAFHSPTNYRTTGSVFSPLNPKFGAQAGRCFVSRISGNRCTIRKIAACPSNLAS